MKAIQSNTGATPPALVLWQCMPTLRNLQTLLSDQHPIMGLQQQLVHSAGSASLLPASTDEDPIA
jgi:hypothetical protein